MNNKDTQEQAEFRAEVREWIEDAVPPEFKGLRQGIVQAPELTEEEKREVHDVYHPLVLHHPVTGRPGSYGVASTSRGIHGIADAEALSLLDRLTEHASEARFVYAHSYRVGDIVLWDNFSLMHKATLIDRASGPGTRRYLHRISTKAIPVTA